MKKIFKLGLALALFGVSTSAFASTTTPLISRQEYTVGQGDLEVNFNVDVNIFRGDFDTEEYDFTLGANYFLTDIFAPGVEVRFYDQGLGSDFLFLPNLKAYWPLHKRILPYAIAGIGFANFGPANLFIFGFGPGIDFLISNNVAIGAQLRYELGTGDGTLHRISFPIDFAIYFKY